jgi:hypothetical protein
MTCAPFPRLARVRAVRSEPGEVPPQKQDNFGTTRVFPFGIDRFGGTFGCVVHVPRLRHVGVRRHCRSVSIAAAINATTQRAASGVVLCG